MGPYSTYYTLAIQNGDLIYVGARRQSTSPQTVTGVSSAQSNTTGQIVYTITTAQGTYNVTVNTTTLSAKYQSGQSVWDVCV